MKGAVHVATRRRLRVAALSTLLVLAGAGGLHFLAGSRPHRPSPRKTAPHAEPAGPRRDAWELLAKPASLAVRAQAPGLPAPRAAGVPPPRPQPEPARP